MVKTQIETNYGRFLKSSKRRLDLAFDYEATEINVFRRIADLLGSTYVFDIGANIGLYSIASLELKAVEAVYGFEASRQTFDEMQSNFDIQDTTKKLFGLNRAVSDKKDILKFREFGSMAGNNAIDSTSFISSSADFQTVSVEADKLDNLVKHRNSNIAIKIDVEGHEIEVLRGAGDILSSCVGFLQIEIIGSGNKEVVDQILRDLGYELIGWLKSDYYYVHRSLARNDADITAIIFEELQVALTRLKSLNQMRRRVLRECSNLGDSAGSIRQIARFKKDPVLDPNVYKRGKS